MATAVMTATWLTRTEAGLREAAAALGGAERLGVERDVPLRTRTYIGVGGPARIYLAPSDPEALAAAIAACARREVPLDFLGAGSNLLISDDGPEFVVVASERLAGEPRIDRETVRVGAGYGVPRLVQRLQRAGLAGLEFAEGIPGSVGGAVRMNAGWHAGEFGARVASLLTITRRGEVETVAAGPGTFAYRSSPGLGDRLVVEATLVLTPDDPERIAASLRAYRDQRVRTQPTGERNAGCMFKNPPGDHAGRLIDACGLKGAACGAAMVSPVHANFFINRGGATFQDVRSLMDRVRETVRERAGVILEPEVVLWV